MLVLLSFLAYLLITLFLFIIGFLLILHSFKLKRKAKSSKNNNWIWGVLGFTIICLDFVLFVNIIEALKSVR